MSEQTEIIPTRVEPSASRAPFLLLASKSPRRRLLLRESGIEHELLEPGIDDSELEPGGVDAASWVASLAYMKATAAARNIDRADLAKHAGRSVLVLGADTVVCKRDGSGPGTILGQPADAHDAERFIKLLENGEHEVLTGVALVEPNHAPGLRRCIFVDSATVRVGTIGDDRIRDYLDSGDWQGKAGAYNLMERINDGWPITYVGDPTTVMGLPMQRLSGVLSQLAG